MWFAKCFGPRTRLSDVQSGGAEKGQPRSLLTRRPLLTPHTVFWYPIPATH